METRAPECRGAGIALKPQFPRLKNGTVYAAISELHSGHHRHRLMLSPVLPEDRVRPESPVTECHWRPCLGLGEGSGSGRTRRGVVSALRGPTRRGWRAKGSELLPSFRNIVRPHDNSMRSFTDEEPGPWCPSPQEPRGPGLGRVDNPVLMLVPNNILAGRRGSDSVTRGLVELWHLVCGCEGGGTGGVRRSGMDYRRLPASLSSGLGILRKTARLCWKRVGWRSW